MSEGITSEGLQLVKAWLHARSAAIQAQADVSKAAAEQLNAERALAKWMAPAVIKPLPGEKITIWVGDSLLQLEVGGVVTCGEGSGPGYETSDKITVRFQGGKFHELSW